MAGRTSGNVNGIRLSYVDFGGNGNPLLALHGHYGCASMFAGLAEALGDKWRVIALDQRGHGWSEQPDDYSRAAYVDDVAAFIGQLGLAHAVVLGHSLGGLNAYQLAAWRPGLVKAMIVEDIGAVIPDFPSATEGWHRRVRSLKELMQWADQKGYKNDTYFLESLIEYPDGWGFRFDYEKIARSMRLIAGDWWQDWLATTCPTLLLHGHKSWVLETGHAREMAARRPNTRLIEFPDCGHTIHDEKPDGFFTAVKEFLASL
jgi:pimeloyl-ACP methyl ester carboxylesterase